jgi:hypothetical protein
MDYQPASPDAKAMKPPAAALYFRVVHSPCNTHARRLPRPGTAPFSIPTFATLCPIRPASAALFFLGK